MNVTYKRGKKMRRKQDEFADFNGKKKRGNMFVIAAAILAICFSGILYARKLQMDTKYISMYTEEYSIESKF